MGGAAPGALWIDQGAILSGGALAVAHPLDPACRADLFVIEDAVCLKDDELAAGDQARMRGLLRFDPTAIQPTELLVIDRP